MKTIAQILLSLALSLGVTAGLNPDVRGKIAQTLQTAEATVAQVTDFAAQTVSGVIVNANAQVSAEANAGASADAQGSASASANADAQSSASASSDGSFLNFLFGGQSGLNVSVGSGQ